MKNLIYFVPVLGLMRFLKEVLTGNPSILDTQNPLRREEVLFVLAIWLMHVPIIVLSLFKVYKSI